MNNLDSIEAELQTLSRTGTIKIVLEDLLNEQSTANLFTSQSTSTTENFLKLCDALMAELNVTNSSVPSTSLRSVFDALKSKLYFTQNSDFVHYKLVHFLCSQIKTERLISRSSSQVSEMKERIETAGERGKRAFLLEKIRKEVESQSQINIREDVGVDYEQSSGEAHEADVIARITSTLEQAVLRTATGTGAGTVPLKILSHSKPLDDQQTALVEKYNESFHHDFQLRRRMLLCRLNVTVQSFLWSEKVHNQENEDEVRTAIAAQQAFLQRGEDLGEGEGMEGSNSDTLPRYDIAAALLAPPSLLHELTRKVTSGNKGAESGKGEKGRSKSVVKSVIVGRVPDRGGRMNEIRPKQFEAVARGGWKGGVGGGGGGGKGRKKGRGDGSNKNSNNSNSGNSQKIQKV